ncbi:hypothetical protein DL93DRAFT_578375 [Clavulina sp. PMI_390]|nr:hypothetical protein DL93DRAFT_578375 [Clavulina sp. PMI_390]
MTENEEDEGDGEGGDAERIPDGFTLLDETKFVLVPARFKEYRETLGKYVEAGSRTETYQEKVESYPFHFILYRKASDSVDYVRVSEIHYMKLDELESCLMADGVDDKERDQKLLDRYSMAWESEDPEDDANLITTRNLKKLVAQKKSQHKHGPALVEPTGKTSTQRVKSAKVPRVQLDTQEEYDPSGKTTLADMMNKKEEGIKRAKQSHEDNLKWIRALAQFEIYLNMAESACRPLRVQYDPTIRFWDPIMTEDHDEIPIRFECSSYLSKYALAALVHMALKPCRLRANIEIVGAKDDGKNQQEKEGYFLIGSHLLNFYRTYTTEGGLRTLQRLGQHGPLRPFPNPKQVKEVGMLLKIPDSKNGDTRQDTQTQIAVTLLNTVRKKRGISQQQIASVSATILAQKFGWPANSLTSLKNKTNTGSEEHKTNDDKHEKAPEPSKASDYSQSSWSNQAETPSPVATSIGLLIWKVSNTGKTWQFYG